MRLLPGTCRTVCFGQVPSGNKTGERPCGAVVCGPFTMIDQGSAGKDRFSPHGNDRRPSLSCFSRIVFQTFFGDFHAIQRNLTQICLRALSFSRSGSSRCGRSNRFDGLVARGVRDPAKADLSWRWQDWPMLPPKRCSDMMFQSYAFSRIEHLEKNRLS